MSIKINRVWDIVGKRVMTYMLKWCDLHDIEDIPAYIGDWRSVDMVRGQMRRVLEWNLIGEEEVSKFSSPITR